MRRSFVICWEHPVYSGERDQLNPESVITFTRIRTVERAVSESDSVLVPEATNTPTASVQTCVSDKVMVASAERYYRKVVAADCASPSLLTVADGVKVSPVIRLPLFTDDDNTKSGCGSGTENDNDLEQ